jgi:hypothetical protein
MPRLPLGKQSLACATYFFASLTHGVTRKGYIRFFRGDEVQRDAWVKSCLVVLRLRLVMPRGLLQFRAWPWRLVDQGNFPIFLRVVRKL